jgi:hypothetical protein
MTSENVMVQIKRNMKKYNGTQNLSRHDQVVVSRLKMGYTRITKAYRLDNNPQPECQTCQRTFSVPHILWECRIFESQRVLYGIDKQKLADTVENATNLIRSIKNIRLYNEIKEEKNQKEKKQGRSYR